MTRVLADSGFFGFNDQCETCRRVGGGNNFIFNVIYKWKKTVILSRILGIFLHSCEILNIRDKNEIFCFSTIFTFISQFLVELRRKLKQNHSKIFSLAVPVITRWSSWFSSVQYFYEHFYVLIEFFNQYEALPPHGQHLVEYFGNPDTKKIRNSSCFRSREWEFFHLKSNAYRNTSLSKQNIGQ